MSNYFQVLKRVEQERSGDVTVVRRGERPAESPVSPPAREAAATIADVAAPTTDAPVSGSVPPPSVPPPSVPSQASRPLRAVSVEQSPKPPLAVAVAPPAERSVSFPPSPRPEPRRPWPAAPISEESRRGITKLFDGIRALASGRARHTIVFAGAEASESARSIGAALARHAESRGLKVLVAELSSDEQGPRLTALRAEGGEHADAFATDLNGGISPGDLETWIQRVDPTSDLVLLEGPPLSHSIEAALLACCCDGLVIVADAEVTPRATLQMAAERARVAGCHTLGIVMNGTKERLPSWMHRLMGAPRSDR